MGQQLAMPEAARPCPKCSEHRALLAPVPGLQKQRHTRVRSLGAEESGWGRIMRAGPTTAIPIQPGLELSAKATGGQAMALQSGQVLAC